MSVRLLGPVEVVVAGRPVAVNGLRRKAILAALALQPGRVVSTDRLIDVAWGDEAPATAMNSLQSHVSFLRRRLGPAATIVARPPGYLLETGAEPTDVEAAERLLARARQSADSAERVSCLEAAVALWRGQPLADLTGLRWLAEQAEHLVRLRQEAERDLIEARLAAGDHVRLIPELERLIRAAPVDEQLHAQLMLALYRAGRQADALSVYQRLRETLAEELGVDPSPRLRSLETAILRHDPAIDGAPAPRPAAARPAVCLLPPAVPAFAGRRDEIAALDTSTGIAILSGTAGVGKTALAVYWAHRVADRYPDGQLYVNLRGFDPSATPKDPADALREFMTALGLAAASLPSDVDGLSNLYRSTLAGRRVLVVLDNARDAEQVRPLLPAGPGCLAVVTSRDQLLPLVIAEGATPLVLDLPDAEGAREILSRRLGTARVTAEPGATEEIVARCAQLPLALAVVAARAALRPRIPLAAIAAELCTATEPLDAFAGGDAATDVRTVFSWSCRTLSPGALRLFWLLSLHPGPDLGTRAAASLAGVPEPAVRQLLAELAGANLLTEYAAARYTFHDLLRAYAADLAEALGTAAERRDAIRRVLDYYLHTAYRADLLLHPPFTDLDLAPPQPGVQPQQLPDRSAATEWFTAEAGVLLAAIPYAAGSGFETHAWQLTWAFAGYLGRSGHWHEWLAVQRVALAAASTSDDPVGWGTAHRGMGQVCSRLGRHDEAMDHLYRALEVFTAIGDESAQAYTHLNLGQASERQGQYRLALSHSQRALILFRRAGNLAGEAYLHNGVGWLRSLLGDHHKALASCEAALVLLRKVDDIQGQADTWDSLGYAHDQLGNHRRAITCYENALALFAEVQDRYSVSRTHVNIGRSHLAAADVAAARTALSRAIAILTELGHPEADEVRAELAQLTG